MKPLQQQAANAEHLPTPFWLDAKVLTVLSRDNVKVACAGQELILPVSTHLPLLVPGQRVLAAPIEQGAGLIMAAFPLPQHAHSPSTSSEQDPQLLQFDVATGTLHLQAPHLKLQGIASVELRCGDAVLRLTAQGDIFSQAQAITQSAIGAHRIEGASVDIN